MHACYTTDAATGRGQSAGGLSGTNPGDLTAPEGIDWLDITFLAWNWLIATTLPCYSADLTFDGKVDFHDFVHLGRYRQHEGPEMIRDEPLEAAP